MFSPVKRGFLDLCEEICVFTTTEMRALWFLPLWFLPPVVFYDNGDNNDNGKNGRNGLCHEVTYNKDNKITVVNLFIFRKTKEITSVC